MRILLIGSGSREHAIAWKLKQSPLAKEIFHWPQSPVLDLLASRAPCSPQANHEELLHFIKKEKIDLTVCGPEKPLAEGLADTVRAAGFKIIGPNKKAALLEASKTFAKNIMRRANVPTARFHKTSSLEEAWQKCQEELKLNSGAVIKIDGLASGKGVFVCKNEEEVKTSLEKIKELFPTAQKNLLIEELLVGREFSYFALINQQYHIPMGCAVDFKRLGVNDTGPNTGGMGAYTPVPWLPPHTEHLIKETIIDPLLNQLSKEDISYTGILYCGLMLTETGIKVIEFNVRLGDPEAQVLAANDKRDWLGLFLDSLEKNRGYKDSITPTQRSLGIVMTSTDYPYCTNVSKKSEEKLSPLLFTAEAAPYCFGGSVKADEKNLFPGKGRVLTIVGQSDKNFQEAKNQAMNKILEINKNWQDSYWRQDIGEKIIKEEKLAQITP